MRAARGPGVQTGRPALTAPAAGAGGREPGGGPAKGLGTRGGPSGNRLMITLTPALPRKLRAPLSGLGLPPAKAATLLDDLGYPWVGGGP
jgi:hypothetical protein